jgi:hypothetical protein
MALMQAGLAIAGGKSSNALTNIGEGGMQGVQMFAKGEQESRVLERERMADMRALQQMKNEQLYRQATLGNEAARLGISQQELANRLGETAFKQGPQFEYEKKKAEEERQARIDLKTGTNLTTAASRYQTTVTQLNGQLRAINHDLSDPVKKDDPGLLAEKADLIARIAEEGRLLKIAQQQAGLKVGSEPELAPNTAGFKYLGPATKAP